jgi:hypothetical protein
MKVSACNRVRANVVRITQGEAVSGLAIPAGRCGQAADVLIAIGE